MWGKLKIVRESALMFSSYKFYTVECVLINICNFLIRFFGCIDVIGAYYVIGMYIL